MPPRPRRPASKERRATMSVTVSYSLQSVQAVDPGTIASQGDVAAMSDGGFVFAGTHAGHTDLYLYDSTLAPAGNVNNTVGTNPDIAQLADGNLVYGAQDADSVLFAIKSPAGLPVPDPIDLGDTGTINAAVAGLTGGRIVIVREDTFGSTDHDVEIIIRNADGTPVTAFSLSLSADLDEHPSVAALDNGDFAVAWTRTVAGNTQVWYAVYGPGGTAVQGPTLHDNVGTINRNVQVAATDGGFALVYEDNGWATGTVDITLARFHANGSLIENTNISNPTLANDASNDANPTVSRLSNGFLAVAYEYNYFADTDLHLRLVGTAGESLAALSLQGGQLSTDDIADPSLAGLTELGRMAAIWTNLNDDNANAEVVQAVRTTTGDGAANALTGDELADNMLGGGGNDTLTGGLNADTPAGGLGNDTYVNPRGDTIVENAGQGTDTVQSDGAFSLAAIANVERLFLTGAANINGTGNTLNNYISGNTGNNSLNGGDGADTLLGGSGNDTLTGGAGADSLNGGAGNDTYVNPTGDTVTEAASAGTDTVQSNATFSLAALANVERLVLTGSANITGTGNALNNLVSGNSGNNTLYGMEGNDTVNGGAGNDAINGGAGNDTMNGGAGADTFTFGVSGTGNDRIEGFSTAEDRFGLGSGSFTGRTEAGGNTTLTHAGGTILIVGVTGLTLGQWNALTAAPYVPEHDTAENARAFWHGHSGDYL